jgi:AbiV family abortive infection protein
MVTAQYLLEGAIYAAEQCGHMMRDAVSLYDNGRYSSSIALSAFAREELGRSRILRELRQNIVGNRADVTLEEIQVRCDDHVIKQEYAQLISIQRFFLDDSLGKLMKRKIGNLPQSEEFKEAEKQLDDITKRQKKRAPGDRHRTRMRALYVEPEESGVSWNRPKEVSREQARIFLEDTAQEYALAYDQLQRGNIRYRDPEFASALGKWADRPELPAPQWPSAKPPTGGS